MTDFVHLHVHSSYSLLQGAFTPEELAGAAARAGMPAVALTDTNGIYGAVRFYHAARKAGVKPIVGAELVHGPRQCVLLAADRTGYANLCRIVTERRLAGTPHHGSFLGVECAGARGEGPEFDLAESVAAHPEGLFVLTATPGVLERLHGRVPEGRLYAELRADSARSFETECPSLRNEPNSSQVLPEQHVTGSASAGSQPAADAAERLGIPLAATVNVNFLHPEDRDAHAVLCAIRENRGLGALAQEGRMLAGPRSFFHSPEQMAGRLPGAEEALRSTVRIAEACELELEPDGPRFPRYDRIPEGETACSYLRKVARRGARRRYGKVEGRVRVRLERELKVIQDLGFCHYFLVVWDIARFAEREGIPHVGRGSAANSIVSYSLGISAVDPLRFDLYFERFLNEHRRDVPDIDMDFCWRRRDEVIDYVYERYPAGRVAMVSTHSTLRARSAFRDVARVMGLPLEEIDHYSAMLPHHSVSSIEEAMERFPETASFPAGREPWKGVLRHALKIDGYVRHLGIHLGGVVVGERPLTHYTALEDSTKGIVVTQYDMDPAEEVGLVKIDLLGQRSLSIVSEAARAVERDHGASVDLGRIPDRDARTAQVLRRGRTMGCFQIESPGMRQLLQMLEADSILEVIQGLSLIRPGPSGSGMKGAFIRRMRGEEPAHCLTPRMEEALAQTYGVMLYQEDILKVAEAVAGFTLAQGDQLRRAITKASSPAALRGMRDAFVGGARARGVAREAAEKIWGQIESFAAYSYCKAHATTYGHISYQAAYLKAHYPAEFLASVIANKAGFYDARAYYQDARRFNVQVLPPSVNESEVECRSERRHEGAGAIRPGLESVRALSVRTIEQILARRLQGPFGSLEDFCGRVRLTAEELENLILCGAFDWTGENRSTLVAKAAMVLPAAQRQNRAGHEKASGRAERLFGSKATPQPAGRGELPPLPPFSRAERVRWELRVLGMAHSGHPLDALDGQVDERQSIYSFELPRRVDERVSFIGWLVTMRHAVTRDRKYMKFLCLEDRHGVVEVVVFPDVYRRWGHEMADWGAYRVEGRVKEQHGAVSLVAQQVKHIPIGRPSALSSPVADSKPPRPSPG